MTDPFLPPPYPVPPSYPMQPPYAMPPSYPAPPAAPREERPRAVRMSEALLVGAGLLGVVIAGLLAFLPLPVSELGTCGPRYGSSSALSVYRDPYQVLDWQPPRAAGDRALYNACLADAKYRVHTAVVLAAGGLLLGGCAGAVEAVWRRGAAGPRPPAPYGMPHFG